MEGNKIKFKAPVYGREEVIEKKNFSNKVALIDADRYKHLVTFRLYQQMMDEGFDVRSKSTLNDIIDNYLAMDIFNQFEAKHYVFCFSAPSKNTFRHSIAQQKKYKGNREGKVDKYFYEGKFEDMAYVFTYINKLYPTLFFDDLEADDILSMIQDEEHTFIYSTDKDLKQVVGYHYNIDRRILEYTDEEKGVGMLIGQILKGDSVDNIPGLERFGEKALEAFEKENEGVLSEQKVMMALKQYINKYGLFNGVDSFVEMWGLASMKMKRGDWFMEKYAKAFNLINILINDK